MFNFCYYSNRGEHMRRQLLEHMRCLGRSDMRLAHLLAPVEWILKGWFLVHDIDWCQTVHLS